MSCSYSKGAWEVRWRDAAGRQRSRRFGQEEKAAKTFDEAIHEQQAQERRGDRKHGRSGGAYPYKTASGTKYRYVVRRTDGSMTSKRGFSSEEAARKARRRVVEKQERGEVRHTKETFGEFWDIWLSRRKPHLEEGTWEAYERDGRLRLLPALADVPLGRLDVDCAQDLMDELVEAMEADEIAAKTINNTFGTLSACLSEALKERKMPVNAAMLVPRLPLGHIEREYLRLHEIPIYLDSCSDLYRPVASTQIGAGTRISETLALQINDLDLEDTGGLIVVYRSRKKGGVGSTKSDRFHSVEIGRGLVVVLRRQLEWRAEMPGGDKGNSYVFVMPVRTNKRQLGRWDGRGAYEPMDRTTISRDWHKAALQDAGLRDMPLHALRHTAAAAWLAAGNSLMYVQHQLNHAGIATTERYYGHLQRNVLAAGANVTEDAIERAALATVA